MTINVGVEDYQEHFGQPTHDDQRLFELLTVGVFQVGLSWRIAASKLPVYRRDFAGMQISQVAALDEPDIERISADPEMIRNPRKIRAVIQNARAIRTIQESGTTFADYMWGFVNLMPVITDDSTLTHSRFASLVAKQMKQQGFTFVGPTVTHMFMKAAGIIQS